MNLKTKVLVRSISSLSDARYCAGMGVDMLGFDINPSSSSYVDPVKFTQITSWVAGTKIVIQSTDKFDQSVKEAYKVDIVETSNINHLSKLKEHFDQIILSIEVSESNIEWLENEITSLSNQVALVLLSFESFNFMTSHIVRLIELSTNAEIFVKTDFELEQLDSILKLNPYGLVLEAGLEEKVGFKDYDDLADILEALQLD